MSQETITQRKQQLIDLLNDYNKCLFALFIDFKQSDPLGAYVDIVSVNKNRQGYRYYKLKPKSLEAVYKKRDPNANPHKHKQKYETFCRIIEKVNEKLLKGANKQLKKRIIPELNNLKLNKAELNQILPEIIDLRVSDFPCKNKGDGFSFRDIICHLMWNDLNIEKVVYKSQIVKNIVSTGLFDDTVKNQTETLQEMWQLIDKIIDESRHVKEQVSGINDLNEEEIKIVEGKE